MKNNKKKGFTLIEMVVVIAIIAIVAGIAMPQALKSINKSKATADIANAKNLANEITQWQANGANYLTEDANDTTWTEITTTKFNTISSIPEVKAVNGGKFYYNYYNGVLSISVGYVDTNDIDEDNDKVETQYTKLFPTKSNTSNTPYAD